MLGWNSGCKRRRTSGFERSDALDVPRHRSEYQRNKEEGQRNFDDRTDPGGVHRFIQPNQVVGFVLLAGMVRLVLRTEMFSANDIVSGGDIGKQRGYDETDADDVKPSRSAALPVFATEGRVRGAGQRQSAEQEPSQIQSRLELHSFLP